MIDLQRLRSLLITLSEKGAINCDLCKSLGIDEYCCPRDCVDTVIASLEAEATDEELLKKCCEDMGLPWNNNASEFTINGIPAEEYFRDHKIFEEG